VAQRFQRCDYQLFLSTASATEVKVSASKTNFAEGPNTKVKLLTELRGEISTTPL
jgi:hypothetical protein